MPASVVGICNSALLKVGGELISSLSDTSKSATACNEQWEKIRDEVLSDHPWNCAIKRADLSASITPLAWGTENSFPLPNDCLRVIGTQYPDQIWRVENGLFITEWSEAKIRYLYRNTDTSKYPPKLAEAMSLRLAADLAYHLAQSSTLSQQLYEAYKSFLSDAKGADAQEGNADQFLVTDWTDSRY